MSVIKQMQNTKSNLQALMPLIAGKVVSDSILKKNIFLGTSMHHLNLAYQRKGFDGFYSILTESKSHQA